MPELPREESEGEVIPYALAVITVAGAGRMLANAQAVRSLHACRHRILTTSSEGGEPLHRPGHLWRRIGLSCCI
jgi:hypothetical protein